MSQQMLPCTPPPTVEDGFISYRCLVFLKKCPQREACTFRRYSGYKPKNMVFEHNYSLKPYFDKLNIF